MGQTSRKHHLDSCELRKLKSSTYMDKKELNRWFNYFMTDCPDGLLRKEIFCNVYQQWFPDGNPSVFAGFMFDAFDANKSGFIEFSEFVQTVSTTTLGSMDEKLIWAFKLYDHDADGYISREDMLTVVSAIYDMFGSVIEMPADENTPEKRVDKIFKQMDLNHDGKLSQEEFIEGSKSDPWVVESLNIYLKDTTTTQPRRASKQLIGRIH